MSIPFFHLNNLDQVLGVVVYISSSVTLSFLMSFAFNFLYFLVINNWKI